MCVLCQCFLCVLCHCGVCVICRGFRRIRLYIRFVVFLCMNDLSSLVLALGVFVFFVFIVTALFKRSMSDTKDSEH